jgi:RNA 2',3'-cyclic 3'-phosphodiesterase
MEDRGDSARVFLALWPGAAARLRLVAWRQRWAWPPAAQVVADGRLHLTLHFLGDVPRAGLPALVAALHVPAPPFELLLDQALVWPQGVAVLQPSAPDPALATLQAALADALRAAGIAPESRRFRPHVTLARQAQGARPPADEGPLRWPVRGYALMQSDPALPGAYRVLANY